MDNLLSAYYTKKKVDAVLSPYDGISHRHHFGAEGRRLRHRRTSRCRSSPARTPKSRRSSRSSGTSSIRRSSRTPATSPRSRPTWSTRSQGRQAASQRHQDLQQRVKIVPSYLLKPVPVDATNWKHVLVDSGYYKLDQLQ